MSEPHRPVVEILSFEGCPHHEAALALVAKVARELALEPELRLVRVVDGEDAERRRFLGSPTIRVDGVDVDPHSETNVHFALSCRVFLTSDGPASQPEERWVRDALLRVAAATSDHCADVLRAAAIPNVRLGRQRMAGLDAAEREFYRWILERFAQASPPTPMELGHKAGALVLDPRIALARLAKEDLVGLDADGGVGVAYPFSARPRGHRVVIDSAVTVEAMCAIDALGIAAMLKRSTEISSRDPTSGTEIHVSVDPEAGARWQPRDAVVLAGTIDCDGQSCCGCCDVLNFFESEATLERYLEQHPRVGGTPIDIPTALEAGRAVFAEVFIDVDQN